VGWVFFVWISVFNLFIVAVFWSLMADVFDGRQARRLFGLISAGGTAGALVGPLLAERLVGPLGLPGLLLVSAALLEASTRCVTAMTPAARRGAPAEPPPAAPVGGGLLAGMTLVLRRPMLTGLSVQMLCMTAVASFLYLIQARIVAAEVTGLESRLALFARIDLAVSVLGILTQGLLTGPILTRLGVRFALRVVPVAAALGLATLALSPVLLILAAVQVVRRAGHYAVERPAQNLLYTAVGLEEKYKAKGFIDTVVYRGGDATAAALFGGLAAAGLGLAGLALAVLPLTAVAWHVAGRLAARHGQLEEQARRLEGSR
jgi:AAA family ATP:ADP antiporter